MKQLPDKLSDLLELAVNDCIAAKKSGFRDGYSIKLNMRTWYVRLSALRKVCHICMAGAVMDQTLKIRRHQECSPYDFFDSKKRKMGAINCTRVGCFENAYLHLTGYWSLLGPRYDALVKCRHLVDDDFKKERDGGRAKWATYREAVKLLRTAGL